MKKREAGIENEWKKYISFLFIVYKELNSWFNRAHDLGLHTARHTPIHIWFEWRHAA